MIAAALLRQAKADAKGAIVVGRCPLGTLFGVYDIIEREFGVRWFVPDEQQRLLTPERKQVWVEPEPMGEVIPNADSVSVGTFRREFKPSFAMRWVREGDWALRNRMNVWVRVNGQTVGVNAKWYVHTFGELIPPAKYFAAHPEWFALVKGKRQGFTDPEHLAHDSQLCTGNPEVVEKLAQRLIETIEADPTIEMITLSANDGGGFCECGKCEALDGPKRAITQPATPPGRGADAAGVADGQRKAAPGAGTIDPHRYSNRMAILHNEVARRVARRFPHVKIKVLAYGYYLAPPDIADFRLKPNLLVQVVGSGTSIDHWARLTDQLGVYKAYALAAWGKARVLRGMVHEMRDDIPAMRRQGVKLFYTQSMQQPWTQCPLNHYIAAKLAWNADLDVDWLIADYCGKFFEKAAAPMRDYVLAIEEVSQRYPFSFTYDSSPLVYPAKDGNWLVIAHEHKNSRTVAMKRDTGEIAWTSEANQPGNYFFGYSYYLRPDGSRLILMSASNGLHAMSGDTGRDEWRVPVAATGGVTPAVDQVNGWIFYQCSGNMMKLDARTGAVLKAVTVTQPAQCVAWNTVLTADLHGSFVATYWIGPTDSNEWGSGIRVFDKDLNLVWEKTGIPAGKKATLTYADGKLVTGSGNQWNARYTGDRWKYIAALDIATGAELWRCDLSAFDYTCILNVPHFNGHFYAETQDVPGVSSKVFRIDAATGHLEEVLDCGRDHTSCATSIIARGRLLSGDLAHDRLVVTELATGARSDWPGPFGDPQLNHLAAPTEPTARPVPMREIREP